MKETESIKLIHEIRRQLLEEEERLGTDEFLRRQRERVAKFLEGTRAKFVPPRRSGRAPR